VDSVHSPQSPAVIITNSIMNQNTECPKCKSAFQIKENLKYRLRADRSFVLLAFDNIAFPWRKGLEEIYKAHLVICPNCKNEFSVSEYNYFGFLKVKHFIIGLMVFFLLFIFAPIVVMFLNIAR